MTKAVCLLKARNTHTHSFRQIHKAVRTLINPVVDTLLIIICI